MKTRFPILPLLALLGVARDGLPKFNDFPAEIGGSGEQMPEQPDCETAESDSNRGSETKAKASNGDLIGA